MKVLVTRPLAQAEPFAEALRLAGFEPVTFPVIEIRPANDLETLGQAIANLPRYDWLVFTSMNAVEVVCEYLQARADNPQYLFKNLKIAAIGSKTAQALRERGIFPTFVPNEYVAEAILPGLGDLRGKWVLLPRAEIARKTLPEAITAAGGQAHEVTVYHTLPTEPASDGLAALRDGVAWVTFTSSSAVENFVQIVRCADLNPLALPGSPRIACIGPITAETARLGGFTVAIIANPYTTEGLIQAMVLETYLSPGNVHVE